MTYREVFSQLLIDLDKLDKNEPTIVTYEIGSKSLTLRQLKHMIMIPYINLFFFPKKGFEIGVLTQAGLRDLIYNVNKILNTNDLDNMELIPNIEVLSTSFYRHYSNPELIGPQRFAKLKYVSVTNKFLTRIYCKIYNDDTRLIWKSWVNFKKFKSTVTEEQKGEE